MRSPAPALVVAISLGLAGLAGAAIATASSAAPREDATSALRRSAVPSHPARVTPTPAGAPRPSTAKPPIALAASNAARLAAPACAQYAGGLAGRFPDAVRARGSRRELALLTVGVAAALLGLPIEPARASMPARDQLDEARGRLSRALAASEDGQAAAIARATAPRIQAYARALGVEGCG